MLTEDFHSGDDVTLSFLERTYRFSRRDFEQRVLRAALDLQLAIAPLDRSTRADLIEATIIGLLEHPRSEAGTHITNLVAAGLDDPIYWLRKLVFRSAWLDHRIKHGLVEVSFDETAGRFHITPGRYPLPTGEVPCFAVVTVPEDHR